MWEALVHSTTSYFQIQTSLLASESNVANLRTKYNMENLIYVPIFFYENFEKQSS